MKSETGSIYITFIILVCFISGLSSLSFLYFYQILQLQKGELFEVKQAANETKNIIDSLSTNVNAATDSMECFGNGKQTCFKLSSIFNPFSLHPNINFTDLTLKQEFPQIDWDYLLLNESFCLTETEHLTRINISGTPLSIGSSVWDSTCQLSILPLDTAKFKSNLEINSPIQVIASPTLEPYTIAASGYIHISSELTVLHDTLIVAGGDINISKLISTNSQRISLFSTTGMVSIENLTGNPKLRVISNLGHFIQGPYQTQPEPLLPKLIKNQMLFMAAKDLS